MHALISRLLPISLLAAGCHSEGHDDAGHGSTEAHSSTAHEHGSTTGTTSHDHATAAETTHAHGSETTQADETGSETHAHDSETTHEHATEAATSGGPQDPAEAYCQCMVVYCHDQYHGTWGEDHEMSEAMCEAAANALPSAGMPTTTGNSLECRSHHCELAKTDPTACPSAIGGASCM